MKPASKASLRQRVRWRVGLPVLVSVAVHALVLGLAGVYVVREVTAARRPAFAAAAAPPARPVEHRVQIARRASGAAAAASNPSLARITSAASVAAFALPEPAAPAGLAGSLLGSGMNGAALGIGAGAGLATALGTSGTGGRGLMSLTFLGLTAPRVSRVVFVVDVSRDLMDIRKGGFEAFAVIRGEIARLVTQLPPTARFGVVLFGGAAGDVNRFAAELTPATAARKEALVAWIRTLNARPDQLGTRSAGAYLGWRERELPGAGLDPTLLPPPWLRALRAALELEPDTLFLVTGSAATALRPRSDERRETLERRNDLEKERLRRRGIDPETVGERRRAALAKARRELEDINRQRIAQGKPPFIVSDTKRVFQPDFQEELRRAGFTLVLDTAGWTDARGDPIWELGVSPHEKVPFAEVLTHVARLQAALLRERAAVNTLLFVGPNEQPREPVEHLTALARRNGGQFALLTARSLAALPPAGP